MLTSARTASSKAVAENQEVELRKERKVMMATDLVKSNGADKQFDGYCRYSGQNGRKSENVLDDKFTETQ